jgi:hypothetical protein
MAWKLSTKHKKNITQIETWTKGDMELSISTGWRWGHIIYDEKPDVELDNDEDTFVAAYDLGDPIDMEFDDGCWTEFEFSDNVPEDQRERVEQLYYEDGFLALEEEGWESDDSEIQLYGPLELEEV